MIRHPRARITLMKCEESAKKVQRKCKESAKKVLGPLKQRSVLTLQHTKHTHMTPWKYEAYTKGELIMRGKA